MLLHDGHNNIKSDGGPYLGLDGIFDGTGKLLDSSVLIDPFEGQLHLSTAFVKLSDHDGRQLEVAGQEDDPFICYNIEVTDTPELFEIGFTGDGNYLVCRMQRWDRSEMISVFIMHQ